MRRIKLSIEGRLNEWNSKENKTCNNIWELEVEWYGWEKIIFKISLVIKKFEKDSTEGNQAVLY